MKRAYLAYILPALLLAACGGKETDTTTLTGEIKGLGNDTLYLCGADRMYDRTDTLVVTADKFSATLSPDTLVAAWLVFSNGAEHPIFIDKRNQIHIQGSADALDSLQINGNPSNQELTACLQELAATATDGERRQQAERFISTHPSSLTSIYLLQKYFVEQPQPDIQQISRLIESMTGQLKDRPYISELTARIEEGEKAKTGKPAPVFRLPNTQGKQLTRTDFKNKYLLIHFWASWDSLSRQHNAVYRRLYKKEQKNELFAMLGVSLDMDSTVWKKAVKQDTLKWEQVCDQGGWNAEIARKFALNTLPANVLLSPSGRIEARDLDEAAIEKKLKEIEQEDKKKKEAEKKRKKR